MTKGKTGSSGSAVATRAKSSKSGTKAGHSTSGESLQNSGMEGEVSCKLCSKQYIEKHTKMMKCDRCHGHFCIGCLDFDTRKYEILSQSDSMWFCPPCRVTVEKSILTDRKIEERCREIMEEYEGRIAELERLIKLKCETERTELRDYIKDEVSVQLKTNESQPNTDIIVSEMRERKERENNIVIFGITEQPEHDGGRRMEADTTAVEDLLEVCGVQKSHQVKPKKVIRLGKRPTESQANTGTSRPVLVCFEAPTMKKAIFKNIRKLKDHEHLSSVQIRNDLTKCERERERKLYEDAKKKESDEAEEYIYRVRGPPWSRKIVRLPKTTSF